MKVVGAGVRLVCSGRDAVVDMLVKVVAVVMVVCDC